MYLHKAGSKVQIKNGPAQIREGYCQLVSWCHFFKGWGQCSDCYGHWVIQFREIQLCRTTFPKSVILCWVDNWQELLSAISGFIYHIIISWPFGIQKRLYLNSLNWFSSSLCLTSSERERDGKRYPLCHSIISWGVEWPTSSPRFDRYPK